MWNVGYSYQNVNTLDVGLRRTSNDNDNDQTDGQYFMSYLMYSYSTFGSEINFVGNKINFAPKIGLGYHFFLANANLNLVGYNDGIHFNPTLVPEIGLSVFGVVQINYGYNFFLNSMDSFSLGRNKVSLKLAWFINSCGWKLKKTKSN